MALTVPETIGFCEEVVQFMTTNTTTLSGKGLTVTAWIAELGTLENNLVLTNDDQEAAKADLRVQLARSEQMLLQTDLPLPDIAERAGFKHGEYFSVVFNFKRQAGMPPSRYRAKHRP